jgi:hypothetical protein
VTCIVPIIIDQRGGEDREQFVRLPVFLDTRYETRPDTFCFTNVYASKVRIGDLLEPPCGTSAAQIWPTQ